MNGGDTDRPSPDDKYVARDVVDLRVDVGKFSERLANIRENMVTKEELAKSRIQSLQHALYLIIPLLAAALGALAIMFSGVVRNLLAVSSGS